MIQLKFLYFSPPKENENERRVSLVMARFDPHLHLMDRRPRTQILALLPNNLHRRHPHHLRYLHHRHHRHLLHPSMQQDRMSLLARGLLLSQHQSFR